MMTKVESLTLRNLALYHDRNILFRYEFVSRLNQPAPTSSILAERTLHAESHPLEESD